MWKPVKKDRRYFICQSQPFKVLVKLEVQVILDKVFIKFGEENATNLININK